MSKIFRGDCLHVLKRLPDNSVDSIVTDPPYGFGFMGKKWDYTLPSIDIWKECLRVLKPGGHLLSFGGPRTYHRLACGIEDAGFEIRDQVQWLFGSGFPKSLDVSKAIDKAAGAKREVMKILPAGTGPLKRGHVGTTGGGLSIGTDRSPELKITAPSTDAAKQWQGWGTSLKPANEPICLARKPLSEKTVAANVLKWGVGGLNIDGCRIEAIKNDPNARINKTKGRGYQDQYVGGRVKTIDTSPHGAPSQGRFPANLVFSHSPYCTDDTCDIECAIKQLDAQSGDLHPRGNVTRRISKDNGMFGNGIERDNAAPHRNHKDTGGASRFFLCVKYDKHDECGLKNINADDMFVGKKKESTSKDLNIDGSGSKQTDRYLMGTISITEMGTHSIINFPILNACTKTFIGTCTIETGKTINLSLAESVAGVSVVSATEVLLHFQNGQREPITGIVSLASEDTLLAGVIKTVSTGTRTIGHIAANRFFYCAKTSTSERNMGCEGLPPRLTGNMNEINLPMTGVHGETGKPNKSIIPKGNHHPTVKPIKLMRYLVRLVTPPAGVILDPFMGSGSTGIAALQEKFKFIGIEREKEYFEIAKSRLTHREKT